MAPVILGLQGDARFESFVCVTGQHQQMLHQVLNVFGITPDVDLKIMQPNQTLHSITSRILTGIKETIEDIKPDTILVHGDTSTTFATTLAAYYSQINVGHVEAGLRTGNLYSPWPEEGNRKLTGVLAHYHFAPTLKARQNLLDENINPENIHVTGNTVIDALFVALKQISSNPELEKSILSELNYANWQRRIVLVTGHRRESFGQGFESICKALRHLAEHNPDVQIIYPMHFNPKVREPVQRILNGIDNVQIVEPIDYLPFVYLMNKSHIILTDSGGIQEEAPSLGKPVLVMRDTTERPEATESGTVKLVGTDQEKIIQEVQILLDDDHAYQKMAFASNPFGDGNAAGKILEYLAN